VSLSWLLRRRTLFDGLTCSVFACSSCDRFQLERTTADRAPMRIVLKVSKITDDGRGEIRVLKREWLPWRLMREIGKQAPLERDKPETNKRRHERTKGPRQHQGKQLRILPATVLGITRPGSVTELVPPCTERQAPLKVIVDDLIRQGRALSVRTMVGPCAIASPLYR